ncbi:MAG: FHA domain-containing protein [Bdellovibrionales bacterium]|nr:FHA domain-containing protein [Bdellovibrionales bacterium]
MTYPAVPLANPAKYCLKVLNGPQKGTKFKLIAPKVTLGRSSENDISLENDSKISRQHLMIEFGPHGYEAKSLSNKNPVYINGYESAHALLQNGSKIRIGDTEFIFEIETSQLPQLAEVKSPSLPGFEKPQKKIRRSKNSKKKPSSLTFKIIVGSLILFFAWLFTSSGPKKNININISTAKDIENEINEAHRIRQAKEEEARINNKNTSQYRDAQANYVKGFRDYQKGQFARARDAFQTCLSLYPEHVLCQRYYRLSDRKFNELIQQYMILGRDYQDRNQYQACMNSLRTVMVMMKDRNDPTYKQAKASYDACEAQLGARY